MCVEKPGQNMIDTFMHWTRTLERQVEIYIDKDSYSNSNGESESILHKQQKPNFIIIELYYQYFSELKEQGCYRSLLNK